MDPAPSLLPLLGRGPGIAVFPGAARRLAPPFDQKLKKKVELHRRRMLFFVGGHFGRFCSLGVPVLGQNVGSIRFLALTGSQTGPTAYSGHSQPVLKKLVCDIPIPLVSIRRGQTK